MTAKHTPPTEPATVEPPDDTRARRLDGLFLALLERHGKDEIELLLLDADRHAVAAIAADRQSADWATKWHELARDYAERLHRGRS